MITSITFTFTRNIASPVDDPNKSLPWERLLKMGGINPYASESNISINISPDKLLGLPLLLGVPISIQPDGNVFLFDW